MKKVLTAQITKVDVAKREVWGRAVEEVLDKSNEIFDYKSSVPLFRAWSADFDKATDGKSLGNIRAMHGKTAAGKVIALDCSDANLCIDIGVKVVDDNEWAKVVEGVYTGFSIGGSYVKKWKDGKATRYTASPSEISLVDNPCVPTAMFSLVKADGTTEDHLFAANATPVAPDDVVADDVAKDDVVVEAEPLEKAPPILPLGAPRIDTVQTIGDKIQRCKDRAKRIKVKMKRAKKRMKVVTAITGQSAKATEALEMQKRAPFDPASPTAQAEQAAKVVTAQAKVEKKAAKLAKAIAEADGSVAAIKTLRKRLKKQKAKLRALTPVEQAAKAEKKESEQLDKLTSERDVLAKRVAELEAEPAPAKGVVRAPIDKATDTIGAAPELTAAEKVAAAPSAADAIKAIHSGGGVSLEKWHTP